MLKLLVIAPTCDGDDVGEAWVAHRWVSGLARRHDVTLLTYHKAGSRPASEQLEGLHVVEWPEPPGFARTERLNSMLKPAYIPFYIRARRWIRAALARGERFDLAYQPVPVAMRYPCPAAGLGIPLVVGPVGGSLESPPGFVTEEGSAPWYVGLRSLDRRRLRVDPLLRRTYEGAALVVGIAPYVEEHLSGLAIHRFASMSETALVSVPPLPARRPDGGTVKLLHVGRTVRTKGLRDTIRAVDRLAHLPVSLDVIGDGPDLGACTALVSELGLAARVRFHGHQPRHLVDGFYQAADVFVFPSYREPGGNVAFEAMGHGLPLVVCDRGGPGNVVDETCGFRVPARTPDQLAKDVSSAVTRLVDDPALRRSMGVAAHDLVQRRHLWERRIDQMDAQFTETLERLS